jgi:hypothetical protein
MGIYLINQKGNVINRTEESFLNGMYAGYRKMTDIEVRTHKLRHQKTERPKKIQRIVVS